MNDRMRISSTIVKHLFAYSVCMLMAGCNLSGSKHAGFGKIYRAAGEEAGKNTITMEMGNPQKEKQQFDLFYQSVPNPSLAYQIMRLERYSVSYDQMKKYDSVILYCDSAIAMIRNNKLLTEIPTVYYGRMLMKAKAFFYMNQPSQANEIFYTVQREVANIPELDIQAMINVEIGYIAYDQRNFKFALESFKKSYIAKAAITGDYYKQAEILDNIAFCFYGLRQYDSALYYCHKTMQLIDDNRNHFYTKTPGIINYTSAEKSRAVVLGNMANIYFELTDIDTAIQLARQSIAINKQEGYDRADAQLVQMKLINMYYADGDLTSMKNEMLELQSTLTRLPNFTPDFTLKKQWSQYYAAVKQNDKAFTYLQAYNRIRDSLDDAKQQDLDANLSNELRLKNQEADLSLLQKENQQKKMYVWLESALIILALAIIFLVYKGFRGSRQTVATLTILNEQIQQQKDQIENTMIALEKSSWDKDRILQVVAHDLRNPISGIYAMSSALVEENDLTPASKESIEMIERASRSAAALIGELLAIENGTDLLNKEQFDINKTLRDTAILLQSQASGKKQEIILTLSSLPVVAEVDPDKISRVFQNLLSNAIKFTPTGGSIHLSSLLKNDQVEVSITDTGIGMPTDMQENVFTLFTTARRTGTAGEKSYGIGLSVCKQIVEAHSGHIHVESTVDKGTTFTIVLPIQAA